MLKRLTFGLFVLLALTLLSLSPASARVYITVTPEGASKVPIAVSEFQPMTIGAAQPPQVAEALPARLNANLDLTGVFITLDQRTFLETNPRAGLSGGQNIDFKEWRAVGAELLVKGAFEISGDGLVLELRLYDVVEGRMLLGKRYTGRLEDGRRMINRFTNEIMYIITGEMGVFGTPIVFVSGAGIDSKRIMMTEFGSDEVKGVKAEGSCTMPVLSKGGRLAYVCRRPGRYDLLAGGKIIHSAPLIVSPCFTPGGGLLAAVTDRRDTNIYRFPAEGGRPVSVTRSWGINLSPTLSPDGSQMAFVSNRAGGAQIYISSSGGGPARRLTTEGSENTDPVWSPRGDRIAFVGEARDIYTIKPDGSDLQKLTDETGFNTHPSWSPDGRLIVFASTRTGRSRLYVMTANGERQQPIMPDYEGDQRSPFWSPALPEPPAGISR